jgi:hypothetical protein
VNFTKEVNEMIKKLFVFLLSLSFCTQAFATFCYVEFEPGDWSYDNGVFNFEQGIAIQYSQGCIDLTGYTVNLPPLTLTDNTIYAQGNLEIFDNYGSKLVTAYFDTGVFVDGLRTDIIFYNIDTTEPDTTYNIYDIELVLHATGTKANTFEGNMTYIPEPATLILLGLGAALFYRKRKKF